MAADNKGELPEPGVKGGGKMRLAVQMLCGVSVFLAVVAGIWSVPLIERAYERHLAEGVVKAVFRALLQGRLEVARRHVWEPDSSAVSEGKVSGVGEALEAMHAAFMDELGGPQTVTHISVELVDPDGPRRIGLVDPRSPWWTPFSWTRTSDFEIGGRPIKILVIRSVSVTLEDGRSLRFEARSGVFMGKIDGHWYVDFASAHGWKIVQPEPAHGAVQPGVVDG